MTNRAFVTDRNGKQVYVTREKAIKYAVQRARTDIKFFAKFVFGHDLAPHHEDFFDAFMENDRILTIWPREYGKTGSVITAVSWWIGNFPNHTNVITSVSSEQAKKRLNTIKGLIENNRRYQLIFPWILPDESKPWTDTEINFYDDRLGYEESRKVRYAKGTDISSSLYSIGIAGKGLVGNRISGIGIVDDPHDEDSAYSPTKRERAKAWYLRTYINCLQENAKSIIITTRWHTCLLPGNFVFTECGTLEKIESLSKHNQVVTSLGFKGILDHGSRQHNGNVVSIQTYGDPFSLRVTPEHQVLTCNGWKRADEIVHHEDYIAFPKIKYETNLNLIDFPEPMPSNSTSESNLTGKNKRVKKEDLERYLAEGKTYQEIAEIYGYKNRSTIFDYARLYGITKQNQANQFNANPLKSIDFWRVVGLWIAEGDVSAPNPGKQRTVVRWVFAHNERHLAELVKKTLEGYGIPVKISVSKNKSSLRLKCSSYQLAKFLDDNFGHLALNKRIPAWIIALPKEFAGALVEGYFWGDGCLWKNNSWVRLSSISPDLLIGIKLLLARFDIFAGLMIATRSNSYPNSKTAYELRFPTNDWKKIIDTDIQPQKTSSRHSFIIDDEYIWIKVKSVDIEQYSGPVYDIKTPTKDFMTTGMIVHNSDLAGDIIANEAMASGYSIFELPAKIQDKKTGEWSSTWPKYWSLDKLEKKEREITTPMFQALYMNNVNALAGANFEIDWLSQKLPSTLPKFERVIISVDPALTVKKKSNYTAIATVGLDKDKGMYLLNMIHRKIDPAKLGDLLEREFDAAVQEYGRCDNVIIEKLGQQMLLVNQVILSTSIPIEGVGYQGDKLQKARKFITVCSRDRFYAPWEEAWAKLFRAQCLSFDGVSNLEGDDMVDTVSQAANYLFGRVTMSRANVSTIKTPFAL